MCKTLLFLFFVSDLNGSISQKWRRLRNCCASLRGLSTQNSSEASRDSLLNTPSPRILVSTPHATSSLRLPGAKKSSVQEVLRAKLSRIHVGLRKRRALSVQEFFHSPTHDQQEQSEQQQQPKFYVPSPVSPDSESALLPTIEGYISLDQRQESETRRRARSRQRTINSVSFSTSRDYRYDIAENQGYSLPYEPPPDYDLDDNTSVRRWSAAGSILHKSNFDNNKNKNNAKLENVNIKIPKTKLNKNRKHFERARSHSPNKNKDLIKPIKKESLAKIFNVTEVVTEVVTSKSHYELMSLEQRPEVGQNGELQRMSNDYKQVRKYNM